MVVWNVIASVAAAVGTLLAGFAIWQTAKVSRRQHELTETIHNQQLLLAQRQWLLPLWEHLQDLADINPAEPVWEDVRMAANILELVAVSWEGQMIDENIIRRIFSHRFIEIYDKIEQCVNPPANFRWDGKKMLRESPATRNLYRILTQEQEEGERVPAITVGGD